MDKSDILAGLLDPSTFKVLKLFINNPDQQFYLREIAKRTKVPPTTTFRIIKQLIKLELIIEQKMKRFKFYNLSEENSQFLTDILADRKTAVQEFVNEMKKDPAVEMIILHGKEERNKANILIIGHDIDTERLRKTALAIKESTNFNIIHLTLHPEQYNQMSSMGLYPGKKIILYGK